jgi:hypothetical protein
MLGITRCEIQLIISRIACDPSAISVLSPSRHEIAPCSITLQQIDIRRMAIQVLLLRKKASGQERSPIVSNHRGDVVQGEFGVVLNAPKDTFAKADFSGLDAAHACDMRQRQSVNAKFLWCAKPYRGAFTNDYAASARSDASSSRPKAAATAGCVI